MHVQLRELPLTAEDPQGEVKVELSVIDTGKVRVVGQFSERLIAFC